MAGFIDSIHKLMAAVGAFLASIALRIYLVPVFWLAANNKWNPLDSESSLDNTIAWFENPDWGLGLPFPAVLAFLAWAAEYFGAIALALGFAVRWITIPMMFTMIVAATTVHWDHGWQAVHDPKSPYAAEDVGEVMERQRMGRQLMERHGNEDWLFERGNFVISNNGIEWATTYFVMLLALFALGAGKFFSLDYWIGRRYSTDP